MKEKKEENTDYNERRKHASVEILSKKKKKFT